jgi:hypothetical protein
MHRLRIQQERDVCIDLLRVCRKKATELYHLKGPEAHAKSQPIARLCSKLKNAHKALDVYSYLISENVVQAKGDHRNIPYFERARRLAQNIERQVASLKTQINDVA